MNTSVYPITLFLVGATPIRSPTRLWFAMKMNGYIFRRFRFALNYGFKMNVHQT